MERRPLVLIFLTIVTGIILAGLLGLTKPPIWSFAGIIVSLAVIPVAEFFDLQWGPVLAILAAVLLGIVLYGTKYFEPENLYPSLSSLDKVSGRVCSYPLKTKTGVELTLKPDSYRGKLKVFLNPDNYSGIGYGDILTIKGKFEVPTVFDGFNYREFLRKKEIWGVVYEGKIVNSRRGFGNPVLELGWVLRRTMSRRVDTILPSGGNFLKALLFGARDVLKDTTKKSFTETGLAHLLAASGLHLGIILGVSWWLAGSLGLGRETTYLISLPLVFCYLVIVGFKLPLLRAALIYLFGGAHLWLKETGVILDDWYDRYQALAGAALVLVVINPETVSMVGFQLSFAATFSLALFFQRIKAALSIKPDYLGGILSASIAAQLGVAPVLAVHFGQIHPWAPFINLVAIPGVTAVLYLGILALILGQGIAGFSGLGNLTERVIILFRTAIENTSDVPLAQIQLPPPTPLALVSYFVLIYWFYRKLKTIERKT
ncbi:MAG: ComEC/Rec2 family competence protein [Candidatus Bipolaricaulia bacterium]